MITTHTVYKTTDGAVHWSLSTAESHQSVVNDVAAIMAPVGPPCDIPYGRYVQRDVNAVWTARRALIERCLPKLMKDASLCDALTNRTLPLGSMVGRYFNDSIPGGYRAWSRLDCIDNQGREWDQPYHAMHPDEGLGEMTADTTVPA